MGSFPRFPALDFQSNRPADEHYVASVRACMDSVMSASARSIAAFIIPPEPVGYRCAFDGVHRRVTDA